MSAHRQIPQLKQWIYDGADPVSVVGLSGAAQNYFFSQFLLDFQKPCLVVFPDWQEAEKTYRELQFFMPGEITGGAPPEPRLFLFPPYDISPLAGLSPHREAVTDRLQALYALLSNPNPVVITSLSALAFRVLPKERFIQSYEYLEVGEDVDREALLERLRHNGYERTSLVEERGDYSVRGGVIDAFTPLYPFPVRLEFWGDRLESIRQFDSLSQRSQHPLKEVLLLPANEIIMDKTAIKRARSMGRLPSLSEEGGLSFPGQEAWLNHFYSELDSLFEYLSQKGPVVLFHPHRVASAHGRIEEKLQADLARFRKEAGEKRTPFPEYNGIFIPFEELEAKLGSCQRLEFSALEIEQGKRAQKTISLTDIHDFEGDLDVTMAGKGRVSMVPLAEKITHWLESRSRVVLISRTKEQASRIREILGNYEIQTEQICTHWSQVPEKSGLYICLGRLSKGFIWPDSGLYIISEDEIFGAKRSRAARREKPRQKALTWSNLSQLKEGDYVVHEDHGIGKYGGLVKMDVVNRANDYILVKYAHKDKLYIPADRITVLQKYVGAEAGNPKLDQLGGRSWDVSIRKAKRAVKRIAKQLIQLYALRKHKKGFSFSRPDHVFREFEASFEHEETSDQIKAIEDVLEDMTSERPMDRLICGDVGFGKTEIALRAAFKALLDGKQVAVLVPTTVLAEQHYETFQKRLTPHAYRVGIISRFKTRKEQEKIIAEARSGLIDVLIGTHRILQKDIAFSRLGLLVIDEEQRFGVKQKEALKKLRAMVDVLALTATPIPRTLHMSMMGVRDLSIIETPPEDRLSIQTYLSSYDEALIARAVDYELKRGGQVFFVHNRVQDIDRIADRLKQLIPDARFAIAHGQMKERELEMAMMQFIKKEIDILVCTTIIESGLDIPSANTIIINEADRLGLAQIYQLRGRVGRSTEKAHAYLLLSKHSVLTRDAEKRLKALMDFSHLGAGLHLAMHDLKIRGGGNILGFSQSGHISAVGYELYLKLVEQAVAELKGEDWKEDLQPEVNVDAPAFLPEEYVSDTDLRLNVYRRLSGLQEKSELEAMRDELCDRFGPLPEEADNLIWVILLRISLKRKGYSRLDVGKNRLVLTYSQSESFDAESLVALITSEPSKYRFLTQNKLQVMTGITRTLEEKFMKIQKIIDDLPS